MKKLAFIIIITFVLTTAPTFAKYSGGNGDPNTPYLISTAEDLYAIGQDSNDWDKHFKMISDVNLLDYNEQYEVIGRLTVDPKVPFSGLFDGNNHCISNFTYITANESYIGIFGMAYKQDGLVTIKNLTLIDPNIDVGAGGYCGAILGNCQGSTINGYVAISNCHVIGGAVRGQTAIGGICGSANKADINGCSSSADVIAMTLGEQVAYAGGLVGLTNFVYIDKCFSTGNVISDSNVVGGLLGFVNSGNIENCYSIASVSGRYNVGGFVGFCGGLVTNCYSSGYVDGNDLCVGGFIGCSAGVTIVDSFWDVQTSGYGEPWMGTGLTTAQMKTRTTFADVGWDMINIWNIGENQTYPFLRFAPAGDLNYDKKIDFEDLAILALHWLEGIET